MKASFLSIFLFLHIVVCIPLSDSKCGYESCTKGPKGMINVHIVCHTHDDVGWLKTVDQYFYGSKQSTQNAGVQYILDSVVQELIHDPLKKFMYVETGFFWRWWHQQDDHLRHQVQKLVRNGQLEFISGGWCMNDEATTYYNDIIDQMTFGFRFLNDTFGECGRPRVGWQIDPFGHSREMASLLAQMNFDGLFLGRIDYEDKTLRQKTKTMEFVWQASANLGKKAELFTGILPNTYSPPSGFCFDILCNDEPIMDDPELKDYNVDKRVNEFLKIVDDQSKSFATENLIITMGNDFNYQNAHTWYKNLDKLIKYVNIRQTNGSKVNLFYSTPSCYLQSLKDSGQTWTTKSDDFFPYASDPHAFWTGYFSSRPSVKGYVRSTNAFLQSCKQLDALAQLGPECQGNVNVLREAQAVAQHHDAVSGTEKQNVADDYAQRLSVGVRACQDRVNEAYKAILPNKDVPQVPDRVYCNLLNISECQITETNKPVAVTLYNPLSREVTHFVRLPVTGKSYKVLDKTGVPIKAQIVPIPDAILNLPGRQSNATNEVVFQLVLPPLGFETVFIRPTNNVHLFKSQMSRVIQQTKHDGGISNTRLSVVMNGETGLVKELLHSSGRAHKMSQSFHYYQGMAGDNTKSEKRASGAYIFRPNGTVTSLGDRVSYQIIKGPVVQEIHQKFNGWLTQVIRLYEDQEFAEFQWLVGPIPIEDKIGKEIISRYDSSIKNNKLFYTDSNGRETLQRKIDFRPTFKLNMTEPTSENYYPINTHIFIKGMEKKRNDEIQMTVLTDRAQGGASTAEGSLELMIHRRLLYDDAFGVSEPLNEPGVDGKGLIVLGKHYVLFHPVPEAANFYKYYSLQLNMQPFYSFSEYDGNESNYIEAYKTEFSGLVKPLPANVHLLTLEQWKSGSILLRLEHRFEKTDSPGNMSLPVTVSLENLFSSFDVINVKETSLGANQFLQNAKSFQFESGNDGRLENGTEVYDVPLSGLDVTLAPMQIRSFLLTPKPKA